MSTTPDILYQAAVDDLTGRFFDAFEKRIKQMQATTAQTTARAKKESQEQAKSIGLVAGAVSALTTNFVQMGLQAIQQLKAVTMQSIQLAARADTLAISVENVGRNAGYSNEELARYEEEIKGAGITTIQARQQMVRLMGANLDLAKAFDLARAAQNLAVVAGTNSSEMFNRLTHAILTLNPAILTDIGLNVNLQAAYKAAAAQIGVNAEALDYNTKKQIALEEVLRKAEPMMGTYEAAMTTAGKQAGTMARYVEELQLAIGRAFQPAYSAWIKFQTQALKDAREWFEKNKDSVDAFANALGGLLTTLLNVARGIGTLIIKLNPLVQLLFKLPGAVKDAGTAFAGLAIGQEEAERRATDLGTTWNQLRTIIVGGAAFIGAVLKEFLDIIMDVAEQLGEIDIVRFIAGAERETAQFEAMMASMEARFADIGQVGREAADAAALEFAKAHGVLEDVDEAAQDVADSMGEIQEQTKSAVAEIEKLNQEFTEELADLAKERMRQEIDAAIQASRQRIDIERRAQEQLTDILENAERERQRIVEDAAEAEQDAIDQYYRDRADAEEGYHERLIDIEIDYQRRLEDIEQDWQYELAELVRRNDAVAILRLQRQKERELQEAEEARKEEEEDAALSYERELDDLEQYLEQRKAELAEDAAERLAEFEKSLEEELAAYQENLDKEYEALELSLARREEDLQRHREWEDQDRREAHQAELMQLGEHLASLSALTEEGLRWLVDQHGGAIENLQDMWGAYYTWQEQQAAAARSIEEYGTATPGYGWGTESDIYQGYQSGGFGIATRPTTIKIGETPEAFAALPLNTTQTIQHSFGDMNVNLHGVTPQTEAQLQPLIAEALTSIMNAVQSRVAGGT